MKQQPQIISCKKCGYTDTDVNFPLLNIQFGKAYYRKLCKPCYNKQQLAWKAARNGTSPTKPTTRPWPYPEE